MAVMFIVGCGNPPPRETVSIGDLPMDIDGRVFWQDGIGKSLVPPTLGSDYVVEKTTSKGQGYTTVLVKFPNPVPAPAWKTWLGNHPGFVGTNRPSDCRITVSVQGGLDVVDGDIIMLSQAGTIWQLEKNQNPGYLELLSKPHNWVKADRVSHASASTTVLDRTVPSGTTNGRPASICVPGYAPRPSAAPTAARSRHAAVVAPVPTASCQPVFVITNINNITVVPAKVAPPVVNVTVTNAVKTPSVSNTFSPTVRVQVPRAPAPSVTVPVPSVTVSNFVAVPSVNVAAAKVQVPRQPAPVVNVQNNVPVPSVTVPVTVNNTNTVGKPSSVKRLMGGSVPPLPPAPKPDVKAAKEKAIQDVEAAAKKAAPATNTPPAKPTPPPAKKAAPAKGCSAV